MAKKLLSGAYIAQFCNELGSTMEAGIPVNDGLLMLRDEDESDQLLDYLYRQTEQGVSLGTAIKSSGRFPSYVIDMVQIGEKTGRTDSVLRQLSRFYTRQEEITANIRNAVLFPVVLLFVLAAVLIVLLTQVMPVFEQVFGQLGVEMSSVAQVMMGLGTGISRYSTIIVAIASVIALVVIILMRIPSVRDKLGIMARRGKIGRTMNAVRFSSAMAMTLSSGMDIDLSLDMAKKLCDSATGAKIDICAAEMRKGLSFDRAVGKTGIFGPVDCRKITVSFRTGNTDEVMEQIAADGEKELAGAIDEKIGRIEPALVIIMSVLVGLVLFSVMLPMLSIITTV